MVAFAATAAALTAVGGIKAEAADVYAPAYDRVTNSDQVKDIYESEQAGEDVIVTEEEYVTAGNVVRTRQDHENLVRDVSNVEDDVQVEKYETEYRGDADINTTPALGSKNEIQSGVAGKKGSRIIYHVDPDTGNLQNPQKIKDVNIDAQNQIIEVQNDEQKNSTFNYDTYYVANPHLEVGTTRVSQEGRNAIRYDDVYEYAVNSGTGEIDKNTFEIHNKAAGAFYEGRPQIIEVGVRETGLSREIPFEVRYVKDEDLDFGTREVRSEGAVGGETFVKTYSDLKDTLNDRLQVVNAQTYVRLADGEVVRVDLTDNNGNPIPKKSAQIDESSFLISTEDSEKVEPVDRIIAVGNVETEYNTIREPQYKIIETDTLPAGQSHVVISPVAIVNRVTTVYEIDDEGNLVNPKSRSTLLGSNLPTGTSPWGAPFRQLGTVNSEVLYDFGYGDPVSSRINDVVNAHWREGLIYVGVGTDISSIKDGLDSQLVEFVQTTEAEDNAAIAAWAEVTNYINNSTGQPGDVRFYASPATDGHIARVDAVRIGGSNAAYRITLYDNDNNEVQPNENVFVALYVGEDADQVINTDVNKMLHTKKDGSTEYVDFRLLEAGDGYDVLLFATNSFSTYEVTGEPGVASFPVRTEVLEQQEQEEQQQENQGNYAEIPVNVIDPEADNNQGGQDDTTGDDANAGDNTGSDTTGDDTNAGDNTGSDTTGDDTNAGDNTGSDTTGDDTNAGDNTGSDTTGDDTNADDNTASNEQVEALENRLNTLADTVNTLSEKADSQAEEIDNLNKAVEQLQGDLANANARIATLETKVSELEEKVAKCCAKAGVSVDPVSTNEEDPEAEESKDNKEAKESKEGKAEEKSEDKEESSSESEDALPQTGAATAGLGLAAASIVAGLGLAVTSKRKDQ